MDKTVNSLLHHKNILLARQYSNLSVQKKRQILANVKKTPFTPDSKLVIPFLGMTLGQFGFFHVLKLKNV